MPRYTNENKDGQGTGQSSTEMLEKQGLVEQNPDGVDTGSSVIPKTTAVTGTNIVPPRYIVPNQEDFRKIQLDYQLDPSLAGKMTLVRSGGSPNISSYIYNGPQLLTVDENGQKRLSGKTYSADGTDIDVEFYSVKSAAERLTMISTAQKLGFFYGSKPSGAMLEGNGMDSGDRRAVQDLLDFSVRKGLTWQAVAQGLSTGEIAASSGSSGGGRGYSVVSTEDAMDSVREEFFRVLKRAPTPAEARQAALNIQQAERSRASGGSMDPTSLGVAARAQAEQAAPGEFAANAAGSAMTRIFALLGGQ